MCMCVACACGALHRVQRGGIQQSMKPAAYLSLALYTVGLPVSCTKRALLPLTTAHCTGSVTLC
jgi:hypothetical protein